MSESYTQIQQIFASDPKFGAQFGFSVSSSAYGHVVLIGSPFDTVDSVQKGSVDVFHYTSDSLWTFQQKLVASDGTSGARFGETSTLSADGQTALIGAPGQHRSYVFVKSDTTWTLQAELSDISGGAGNFGSSVSLSGDGNRAFIGQYWNANVIFYTRSGTTWTQCQRFDGEAGLGTSVVLSADASMGLAATFFHNIVRVYCRSDTVWSFQTLLASDSISGDSFGSSIAVSGHGETALVGAPGKNNQQGVAYVFTRSDTVWFPQQKLSSVNGSDLDHFGASVALTHDGNTALIGASGAKKAYVFRRNENSWSQSEIITASDHTPSVAFGCAVKLSGDGSLGLVGDYEFNSDTGSSYFFSCSPSIVVADKTSLTSYLSTILTITIVLFGGIVSVFLFNAFSEE